MMNNKDQAIARIEEFLHSDEKCMLLTGTNQYEKHKLIMRILNGFIENRLILFRTNSMQNIANNDFLGWAGVKNRYLKAGERVKIGKNTYEFDSLNTSSTWRKTNHKFSCAIMYPVDSLCRRRKLESVDDLVFDKQIPKVFLVSWTDIKSYDYSIFSQYGLRHVIYDAEEEDNEYHKRILAIANEEDHGR